MLFKASISCLVYFHFLAPETRKTYFSWGKNLFTFCVMSLPMKQRLNLSPEL